MARDGRTIKVRHVSEMEFKHPILYFIFVRPMILIGKIWLQLLVRKHHLWAGFNPTFFRRLIWFGPAQFPLDTRSAPILVLAGSAERKSRSEAVGDYEPATKHHN